jgi:hypothetical protein
MTRKLPSRKVPSKTCNEDAGRWISLISFSMCFSIFLSFVVCGDRGACVSDLSFSLFSVPAVL